MRREIKFRIWTIESRQMVPWEDCHHYPMSMMFDNPDLYIPQQYSGLKDKLWKEIYEGDIVKFYYSDPCQAFVQTGSIVYVLDIYGPRFLFQDMNPGLGKRDLWFTESFFEVIGNIYENPGLLE